MNKNKKESSSLIQLKKMAVPSIVFVTIGFSLIFLFGKELLSAVWLVVLEVINYFIYLFNLLVVLKDYKYKYIFRYFEFIEKIKAVDNYLPLDKKEKHNKVRDLRMLFFRKGEVFYGLIDITPFNLIYKYSLSYPKDSYDFSGKNGKAVVLICMIYDFYIKDGMMSFFFQVLCRRFSYDEYVQIVKSGKNIPSKLKKFLLNSEFEAFYKLSSLKAKKGQFVEEEDILIFEDSLDTHFSDFEDDITLMFSKTAVAFALELLKDYRLPSNIVEYYISKDAMTRYLVVYRKNDNAYSAIKEKIVSLDDSDNDLNLLFSPLMWESCNEHFGIFSDLKLLESELKAITKDFEKIVIKPY